MSAGFGRPRRGVGLLRVVQDSWGTWIAPGFFCGGVLHVKMSDRAKSGLCCSQDARDSNVSCNGVTVDIALSACRTLKSFLYCYYLDT